jgi:purine-binding chemotaxis protein CheW
VLVCRIGGGLCAFPVRHVIETMRPLPVEPLAGAPPFVLGVSVIRGAAVPVVDTGLLVRGERLRASRLVTLRIDRGGTGSRSGQRTVALAVSGVVGLSLLPAGSLTRLPPLLGDEERVKITAIGVADAQALLVLECARTVPESVWKALSGGGEADG